jgi:uncharacterized protein (TIGR00251 family)
VRISVQVKPNSHQEKIEKVGTSYIVYVKAPPVENRANNALIKLLSEHFRVPKSYIIIVSGHKSKRKIIDIKSA